MTAYAYCLLTKFLSLLFWETPGALGGQRPVAGARSAPKKGVGGDPRAPGEVCSNVRPVLSVSWCGLPSGL